MHRDPVTGKALGASRGSGAVWHHRLSVADTSKLLQNSAEAASSQRSVCQENVMLALVVVIPPQESFTKSAAPPAVNRAPA